MIWKDGAEIRAFQDRWQGGIEHYISWMQPRLTECYRILKNTGSLFLHCDWHANAHLRILLDRIFGENHFRNEIVWCYSHGGRSQKSFGRKHDTIFWYSKSNDYYFDEKAVRLPMKSGLTSFGGKLRIDKDGRQYRLVYGTKNAEGKTKYYKYYLDEGKIPEDYWTDINSIQASDPERLGYPTQKPVALLERLIKVSSKEGDIVLVKGSRAMGMEKVVEVIV